MTVMDNAWELQRWLAQKSCAEIQYGPHIGSLPTQAPLTAIEHPITPKTQINPQEKS